MRARRDAPILVALALLAGCSMTTSDRSPRSDAVASCDRELPVRVSAPGAVGAPVEGAAPGTAPLAPGQPAVHLALATGVVEVRYPPDRRPLVASPADADAAVALLGTSRLSGDGRTVSFAPASGGSSPLLQLTTREPFGARPRPCDRVQVRYVAPDGRTAAVAYREGTVSMYDMGGLVERGEPVDVTDAVAVERSVDCGPRDMAYRSVEAGEVAASPEEALRAFLAGETGLLLDVPTPPRPYRRYRMVSDGTYRFERYTNWADHEAVVVARRATGWAVVGYSIDRCDSTPAG